MFRFIMIGLLAVTFSSIEAKEDKSLRDRLWKAVKEYIKDTDTYKMVDYGRKEFKKIKKKIDKNLNKVKEKERK